MRVRTSRRHGRESQQPLRRRRATRVNLEVSSKGLAEGTKAKSTLHREDTKVTPTLRQDCMSGMYTFESKTKSHGEELKVLAKAKEIIEEATGGAAHRAGFIHATQDRPGSPQL